MRNLFKKRTVKTESKSEEKKGFFKKKEDHPETEQAIETKPQGDFLDSDEDLGYC